jgi:hypothetical protein
MKALLKIPNHKMHFLWKKKYKNIYYTKMNIMLIGAVFGLLIFLINVITLDGVFFRPDETGIKRFTFQSFFEFIKAPFIFKSIKFFTLWGVVPGIDIISRFKMLMLNWVAMMLLGYILPYIYFIIFN